ncbi:MAG: tRNA (adenosine(37)-N6)-threonylcarbamoyltransferase complex ATPase subunit type 1 TsaE [Solirubrobacteraceae bacterium]
MPRRDEAIGPAQPEAPRRYETAGPAQTEAPRRYETAGPAQTEALGAQLASTLAAGDAVLLEGELGTGKTTFVRGACRALGVAAAVTSPTFTIAQRYIAPGGLRVAHVDLFRVGDLAAEEPDLLADYFGPDTIAFVEWPQGGEPTLAGLARIVARVCLAHAGEDRRVVEIA